MLIYKKKEGPMKLEEYLQELQVLEKKFRQACKKCSSDHVDSNELAARRIARQIDSLKQRAGEEAATTTGKIREMWVDLGVLQDKELKVVNLKEGEYQGDFSHIGGLKPLVFEPTTGSAVMRRGWGRPFLFNQHDED